jgi:hypothetical protein
VGVIAYVQQIVAFSQLRKYGVQRFKSRLGVDKAVDERLHLQV